MIAYIAEAAKKTAGEFFLRRSLLSPPEELKDNMWERHQHRLTWGEQYGATGKTCIAIVDLKSGEVKVLNDFSFAPCQVCFGNDGSLYFIGQEYLPRAFGLKYCVNRRASVYHCQLDGKHLEKISDAGKHPYARSLRISQDRSTLVYLSNQADAPHASCARLITVCAILLKY